jgi:hypothetical protein
MPRRNGSYFGLTVNPTPSVASGIWRVREAEEFLRVNKWPATPGVPGSPVASAGNAQVSLTWSAPTLGTPPTDYHVQYSSNSGSTWTTFADGTSTETSAVVTGLTNGTGYIFRVRAVSALGEGPYGAASGVVTPSELDVALLLHFDGTNGSTTFTDSSPNGLTVTASGDAAISTAQSKFGGASLYADKVVSIQSGVTVTPPFSMGSQWTVEAWVWVNGTSSYYRTMFARRYVNNGASFLVHADGTLGLYNGAFELYQSSLSVPVDQWVHVAWTLDGDGVLRMFVNGVMEQYSGTPSFVFNDAATVGYVPFEDSYTEAWDGYIDELRVVAGTAVYTANFTPPAAPF